MYDDKYRSLLLITQTLFMFMYLIEVENTNNSMSDSGIV